MNQLPPNARPAEHPRIFTFDQALTDDLPVLSAQNLSDLSSVLRALSHGVYPRFEAIVTALNAYNLTHGHDRAWAYFHDISILKDAENVYEPYEINLDHDVINDLNMPWQRTGIDAPRAKYRFLCFIHRHTIDMKYKGQKVLYTISVWDREFEWMVWHDMYHRGRRERQRDVQYFWENVIVPDVAFLANRRVFMRDQFRWRMAYHAYEIAENALHNIIEPRHTMWAVMAIGLHYMNKGPTDERHIQVVPDQISVFGGSEEQYLPSIFIRLLWLPMRSPRQGQEENWDGRMDNLNDNDEMRTFVERFRIIERLSWMKKDVRNLVRVFIQEGSLDFLRGVTWFFPALRIPAE
ncbi:hypothetical protein F4808DRAFT_456973 [Astrocystis sublimbata]|nr:hypothetical protein F4808DRAFT_456973 [Astrocystis sublimbata]